MLKKLFSAAIVSLMSLSSAILPAVEYEVQDIGTLQTHSSQAIAINNEGQILGWYNLDGTPKGKRFFVRDKDDSFHELPGKTPDAGLTIEWQYLTDKGAYGTFAVNLATTALCFWDFANGFLKLGIIPGKEIAAINNKGQVLIKSVEAKENGRDVKYPIIWYNGQITKLRGLEGDLGTESTESFGFDINNKGEVVGQSLIDVVYKNKVFNQIHATKWVNGQAVDIYKKVPKSNYSTAIAINDSGDMLIKCFSDNVNYVLHFIGEDKIYSQGGNGSFNKINNGGYACCTFGAIHKENGNAIIPHNINQILSKDYESIWIKIENIIGVNDNGEAIADGETIYGEKHAVLLVPQEN